MSATAPEHRFEAEPNVGNHFAWIRTLLGLQRTLLASVRTSVSLIGFGFTVAQFFEKLMKGTAADVGPEMPRNFGLLLIGAGVISLIVFTYQYHSAAVYLRTSFPQIASAEKPMHTSAYLVAGVVTMIGIVAFISVLFHF